MKENPDSPIEKSGTLKLFPTYVWATQLKRSAFEPINADILGRLDKIQSAQPELAQAGQWQTAQDLHKHPELKGLTDVIGLAVKEICDSMTLIYDRFDITACWANVSHKGFPHRQHIHPNNYLSGAYYVRTAPGADSINFHDPRPQAGMIAPPARDQNRSNPDMITLDVREGMLALFPAWLLHSVNPNLSDEIRVSVAFNIMFPSFGTKMAGPLWQGDTGTGS
ncbi:MAG: 2OG-Fe(II) oxygenase family protein [Gammaproteobacteria bacterium]